MAPDQAGVHDHSMTFQRPRYPDPSDPSYYSEDLAGQASAEGAREAAARAREAYARTPMGLIMTTMTLAVMIGLYLLARVAVDAVGVSHWLLLPTVLLVLTGGWRLVRRTYYFFTLTRAGV